jgi:mannose-6-phosphate isomerase-like protein (cupin superfamily)
MKKMNNIVHVEKPWGYEKHLEINKNYVVKELFMKKDNSCSLQYHNYKHETFYVLKGILKFYVGKDQDSLEVMYLNPGQHYTIEPGVVHRMEAVTDSLYLESSTNFLDDVVRLDDRYGRI